MTSIQRSSIIEEEGKPSDFNKNNIKLAFWLKLLDENQMKRMMLISDQANYAEVMRVIEITNKVAKEKEIDDLFQKYKIDK